MKKRHEQKLILLTVSLVLLFNVPLITLFDGDDAVLGFPISYFSIFTIWLGSVLISYLILKKYYG